MPALVAFNRRWRIGSDDLVFPFGGGLLVRVVWLIIFSTIYGVYHTDIKTCHSHVSLQVFFIGVIIVTCFVILNELAIIWTSMQGTIMNTRPRRRIPLLLYIQLSLYVPEIALSILGIYWAVHDSTGCQLGVTVPVQITVVFQLLILLSVLVAVLVLFDPLGALHKHGAFSDDAGVEHSTKLWEQRCRLLCCCFAGQDQDYLNAISEIAEMFASELHGVDAVPSDVAVGLILLQHQQELDKKEQIQKGEPLNEGTPVNLAEPSQKSLIDDAAYFMRYSVGAYGWPMYVFMHPCCGSCRLCTMARCSTCCRPTRGWTHIIKDNCCLCNTAALHLETSLREEDLFYSSYHNKLYEIPFYVALDHDRKKVVVSVRGTLSMRDTLTDLTGHCERIDIEGLEDGMAHKGMFLSAKYIKCQLIEKDILQGAFTEAENRGGGYSLIVLGHSLGAGTASVLAVLLKPLYPDLRCFAYSNPSVLNESASTTTEEYIMSVVVGNDVVPRMSVRNLNTLKQDLVSVIMQCNKPKYHVLMTGCWRALCFLLFKRDNANQGEPVNPVLPDTAVRPANPARVDDVVTSNVREPLLGVQYFRFQGSRHVEEGLERAGGGETTTDLRASSLVQLYPAGKILQINERPSNSVCNGGRYDLLWANRQIYYRVLISPTMLRDHFPDVVLKALNDIAGEN